MSTPTPETFTDELVRYTVEKDGIFHIVEHVPARVCVETGEQFFSPKTVERLQQIIDGKTQPTKFLRTPVYDFAA